MGRRRLSPPVGVYSLLTGSVSAAAKYFLGGVSVFFRYPPQSAMCLHFLTQFLFKSWAHQSLPEAGKRFCQDASKEMPRRKMAGGAFLHHFLTDLSLATPGCGAVSCTCCRDCRRLKDWLKSCCSSAKKCRPSMRYISGCRSYKSKATRLP